MAIDINCAPRDDLLSLRGVSEELADAIILRRPFNSIEYLLEIPGIGPATLRRLKEQGVAIGTTRVQEVGREDLEDRFKAVFGPFDETLRKQVQELKVYEPRIVKWLQASPKRVRDFTKDPIGTLRRAFPGIALQEAIRELPPLPSNVRIAIQTPRQADPSALNFLVKVWEHISESEANTQAFKQSPFAVIASVGTGYPAETVDAVKRAFEAVFGIEPVDSSQRRSVRRDIHDLLSMIAEFHSRMAVSIVPHDPEMEEPEGGDYSSFRRT